MRGGGGGGWKGEAWGGFRWGDQRYIRRAQARFDGSRCYVRGKLDEDGPARIDVEKIVPGS